MKRIPKFDSPFILAFGAHPDDIEFGCGAVIAKEFCSGRTSHFVICSKGEAATHGTPAQRKREAETSAKILGATLEFINFDGDAHLENSVLNAIALARVIRKTRPAIILAPSPAENQHPDHPRLGMLVRDAARLARYGGMKELRELPPHSIGQLFFYAITTDAEPANITPMLIDISDPEIVAIWTRSMEAHASQAKSRKYVELQLTRARLNGLRAGIEHAIALYPNDSVVVDSLEHLSRGARGF